MANHKMRGINNPLGGKMATIDERIAALETKLKQEKAKKQQIEARKRAAESKVKRSIDTRRKILVGAAILAKVERGEWPQEKLLAMLDASLTRIDDRALFDLPALPDTPAAQPVA
jgi:superfamily I DNA and RNA helicase